MQLPKGPLKHTPGHAAPHPALWHLSAQPAGPPPRAPRRRGPLLTHTTFQSVSRWDSRQPGRPEQGWFGKQCVGGNSPQPGAMRVFQTRRDTSSVSTGDTSFANPVLRAFIPHGARSESVCAHPGGRRGHSGAPRRASDPLNTTCATLRFRNTCQKHFSFADCSLFMTTTPLSLKPSRSEQEQAPQSHGTRRGQHAFPGRERDPRSQGRSPGRRTLGQRPG